MPGFEEWESFYVIVGAAAGALIGLQFVVMTLIADTPTLRIAEAGAAFSSPTVVHFSTSLLLCALLRVPWPGVGVGAASWGLIGLGGMVYAAVVARRMRTQPAYKPDLEDWLFHLVLPLAAYAVLLVAAFAARAHVEEALFAVAGATLLLLFIGIHNSWDAISYHVFVVRRRESESGGKE
jgi:hypothetical protein